MFHRKRIALPAAKREKIEAQARLRAIDAIADYLETHPEIELVRMVCFDLGTKRWYDEALAAREAQA